MSLLSRSGYQEALKYTVWRDCRDASGKEVKPFCYYRADGLCKGIFILHHVDNNRHNNNSNNWRVACKGHNKRESDIWRKNHGIDRLTHYAGEGEGEDIGVKVTETTKSISISRSNKPIFESWVLHECMNQDKITFDHAIYAGAW